MPRLPWRLRGLWQVGGDRLNAGRAPDGRDGAPVGGAQGSGVGVIGAPRDAGRQHHEVGRADPDRHVVDDRDPGAAAVDPDGQQHDHPVLRRGREPRADLVGDQVALAEHDRLAVHEPDRLDDVHMLADDRGDGRGAGEPTGQLQLKAAGLGDVFVTPVKVDDHGLRAGPAGAAGIGQDLCRAGPVDRPRVRRGMPLVIAV